jgi:uncharacterized protein
VIRALALALAASAALPAVSAQAANIEIAVQGPVIELSVSQTVNATPDQAIVGAGVVTRAQTAVEASRLNAERMEKVFDRLRSLGIRAEDIQTANFSLNPVFEYRDRQSPLFQGYDASNQVTVKLRDLKRIGPVLDALVAAGANNFFGPNFALEDDKPARQQARKLAFADAEARARELAGLAGFNKVRLLEISEAYSNAEPMPRGEAIIVTGSRIKGTPIAPGQVGTVATLIVKYEMVR